jgi:hypothetical protein
MQGKYYWCVLLEDSLSSKNAIYLHADDVSIISGALVFSKEGVPMFSLNEGLWKGFFAASCIDGRAVAVEHWDRK